MALIGIGVLGLLVGSFLNVVIWRLPQGESLAQPPSYCPACGRTLRPYDNIPVLSWLLLQGKCRFCAARISARYPAVEILTAALFVVLAWLIGINWQLPAYLWLAAAGIALAFIDVEHHRLPNKITLPSYFAVGALLLLPAFLDDQWSAYLRAWFGAAAMGITYLILVLIYPKGMGVGDVKLAGVLGLALGWLGWAEVLVGGFLAFLLGSVGGIAVIAVKGGGRKTKIPFGPYMLAGALLGIWIGAPVGAWYQGLLAA